ncbi:MAG: cysteine--tRNA ligase [Cycloclasticus sp. symbiont of Bathymodiolus heckerae]|nr:MAG: cysteine--tRNA ligase [Cycloclasticus sp. symbiont of Bathymodiolus heckerae]
MTALKIFNTLTRQKETFRPIEEGKVGLYVCGMTVYDFCHIGHARVMVVFDVVSRYFKYLGYDIKYVRNITDIDDKIIARSIEANEDFTALTQRFIDEMHRDEVALNVQRPDLEPLATESINNIIKMIKSLIEKQHAYVGPNGDVYYSVESFDNYGQLSGRQLDDMNAGERVEVDVNKRNPFDFVLWKSAKPNEPSWTSPWGEGRPGWHIECSAMATCCLGNHFDIHGGGMDLQFPHHENEIAQSEAATGERYVNTWMHNGFVRIDDEKMSKSLGNFFTVRDVLKQYRGEEIRFFVLSSHYRSPLNYSNEQLNESRSALERLYTALRNIEPIENDQSSDYIRRFEEAMNDDFNSAKAISVLFECANEINKLRAAEPKQAAKVASDLLTMAQPLGLLGQNADEFLKSAMWSNDSISNKDINIAMSKRLAAKESKDWVLADQIRDQLKEQGVILEDSGKETTWRRA